MSGWGMPFLSNQGWVYWVPKQPTSKLAANLTACSNLDHQTMLQGRLEWHLTLPVTAMAADPEGSWLAVAVLPGGGSAKAAVLLLAAGSPKPVRAWRLQGSSACLLHFAPRLSPLHADWEGPAPGCGPLVVATEDRTLTVLGDRRAPRPDEVDASLPMAVDSAPPLPTLTQPPGSPLAFGQLRPKQVLFDVPSHVLPPITVMAPAFLNPRLKSQ